MNAMDVALICKALGDANRLEIVQMLSDGEKCGCKLLERFEITQPTLSCSEALPAGSDYTYSHRHLRSIPGCRPMSSSVFRLYSRHHTPQSHVCAGYLPGYGFLSTIRHRLRSRSFRINLLCKIHDFFDTGMFAVILILYFSCSDCYFAVLVFIVAFHSFI